MTDGAHHKQWYLERILELLAPKNEDIEKTRDKLGWEEGIAP